MNAGPILVAKNPLVNPSIAIAYLGTSVLPQTRDGVHVGGTMPQLIAGDPIIDDKRPARILVVDPSGANSVTNATGPVGECFQVSACGSLAAAFDLLRSDAFDAIVLEPNLPDSWPADSYRRLSEQSRAIPILILTDVHDLGSVSQGLPFPFAVLAKGQSEPHTLKHLLISATLRARALPSTAGSCELDESCSGSLS